MKRKQFTKKHMKRKRSFKRNIRRKTKKMVGGAAAAAAAAAPAQLLLSPPDLIPLEAQHDKLLSRADFMREYFPAVLDRLLLNPIDPENRIYDDDYCPPNSFWRQHRILSDNSFIKYLTRGTKTQFRKQLYEYTQNKATPYFCRFDYIPCLKFENINDKSPYIYQMACEEKNNFGNMLNQLVSFIQPDGPDGEEPLHLYFVSDAAHHIFRYIKESYVGDTQLVIHPVVSIETLADPSSPFNHQNDSFTGLASNPKNNITFQMIHDLATEKAFTSGHELLQTKSNLTLTRDLISPGIITQHWWSDDDNFPNLNRVNCNETTRKEAIKQAIQYANPNTLGQKLYIAQAKRMGDYGQISKVEELPNQILEWSNGTPNIALHTISAQQGAVIDEPEGKNLDWESGGSVDGIKGRVFHVTGDFPAFGCAISRGLNSIIMIPNTPHIIIAICTY